jgi:ABC-type glycerol-3-phosphate transport system substrate-binding protein
VRNGEIWAAPGMDFSAAVAVNDCPISYDVNMKVMKDGNLLIYGQNAVMVRDVDPSQRADYSLIIQDYVYNDSFTDAVYDFNNATGVPVILRRGGTTSNILQDMMNRDDSVDIYCMSAQTSEFSALKKRGFIYDLSSNEKLAAMAERMVPYIRDAVTKDGKLVAVPSNAYGYFLGYKPEILKKLGIENDLPKTWSQFFDWIEAMPAKMEGKGYTVFASWTSKWEFRYTLLHTIIEQYQMYINEGKKEFAFNTPQLRELLERVMSIDCDALGLRESSDESDDTGGYWSEDEYKESLIETYTQTSMQTYNEGTMPLLLSFDEGEDPILPITICVSFVNPFSKHAEEAAEFLAMSMKNLDTSTRYSVFADETEPIRYPDFEEYKQNMQKWYEEAKQALETAEDEEMKAQWAQTVEEYEKNLADIDNTYWMVSPEAIAAYQSRIPYLRVQNDDLGTAMYISQNEGSSYYTLMDNIASEQATVEELLTAIDKKVQMMRLEGN